jgi:hypothetical protein
VSEELSRLNHQDESEVNQRIEWAPLPDPLAPRCPGTNSAVTRIEIGGPFSSSTEVRHWKEICDKAGTARGPRLRSFDDHNVPQAEMGKCLDQLATCLDDECIPDLLRDIPHHLRDRRWLFMNPYTILFHLSPLVPIPNMFPRLKNRWVGHAIYIYIYFKYFLILNGRACYIVIIMMNRRVSAHQRL